MDHEGCLSAIEGASRALDATRDLLAAPTGGYDDPVLNAMAALEAARTAHLNAARLVMFLTERALQLGASFAALGFDFTDPYD
jgi:hypothetical protein